MVPPIGRNHAFPPVSEDVESKGMNYSYLHRLHEKQAELKAKLELYEARSCFGDEEIDDGTDRELRADQRNLNRDRGAPALKSAH